LDERFLSSWWQLFGGFSQAKDGLGLACPQEKDGQYRALALQKITVGSSAINIAGAWGACVPDIRMKRRKLCLRYMEGTDFNRQPGSVSLNLPVRMREIYCSRSEFMSNRVLSRRGARELTPEENDRVAAASNACIGTLCGNRQIDDVTCNDG